jgi:uncharacterized protein DUF3592
VIAPEKLFQRVLAVWLGLLFGGFALLVFWKAPAYLSLANHPAMTSAHVTALDCGNHASVRYVYDVGHVRYTGEGGSPGDKCADTRIGDPKIIYYDVQNPGFSASSPDGGVSMLTIMALVLSAMGWFVLAKGLLPLWKGEGLRRAPRG